MSKQFAVISFVLVFCSAWTCAGEKPNIVFFLGDDISQEDFGCYGHPTIKTPNTDALAANGMRFDNAYLTTSSCSPTRCSIITGRYPHNTGAPELHVKLPETQIRFPELLRKADYYTVLSGKNHMFSNKDRAFDKITNGGGPGGEKDWVEHVQNRPKDKPFFFWFASNDAHRGWKKSEDAPLYNNDEIVVPPYLIDGEKTRADLALYYHEVSRFDHFIGQVTAELKKQGVLDNTLIVIAGDNGRPFPRCKSRMYDSGVKTPWVVHYPRMIKRPSVSKSLVSVIDLSATCLELAGIKKPDCVQGQSFVPILKNPKASVREMTFSEHNWHVYKNHERMVRFGDFLYIRNNYPNQPNLCYEAHKDPAGNELWNAHAAGKTTAKQQQIFANPCPAEELYLVSKDPDQFNNLVNDSGYAATLKQARSLIKKWTEQTGDTIPENPTPNRHAPPRVENGKIIRPGKKTGPNNPHAEMPGAAKNAMKINHPGPIRIAPDLKSREVKDLRDLKLPPVAKKEWVFKSFPILAWWPPPGTKTLEDFQRYKEAGFTIYAANPDGGFDNALKLARKAGIPVMPHRTMGGFDVPPPTKPVVFPVNDTNIVGWLTRDEPGGYRAICKAVTEVNVLMRSDPGRWALFNNFPLNRPQEPSALETAEAALRNGMPVLSYDNYVILKDGRDRTKQHFDNLASARKLSLKYDVPFWAFALTTKHWNYRRPSESDVRWKQFTNLAYGAKGLWYFCYWGPHRWDDKRWDTKSIVDSATGEPTELYYQVKTINETVLAMGDILLSLTSEDVMHTHPPQGHAAFAFKKDKHWIADIKAQDALIGFFRNASGGRYALVVNKLHGKNKSSKEMADTIDLTFAADIKEVQAVSWLDGTPGKLTMDGTKASLRIHGGTGVLIKAR